MTHLSISVTWEGDTDPNVEPTVGLRCTMDGLGVEPEAVPAILMTVISAVMRPEAREALIDSGIPVSGDVLELLTELQTRDHMQHLLSHMPQFPVEGGTVVLDL